MNTTNAAANDTAAPRNARAVKVWELREKARIFRGQHVGGKVAEGQHAEIVPGASISLFGMEKAGQRYVRSLVAGGAPTLNEERIYRTTFVLGSVAEYGSFNMSYTGTITAITLKTVTICEDNGTAHRLDLFEFSRRNWNFNSLKATRRNEDWMMQG